MHLGTILTSRSASTLLSEQICYSTEDAATPRQNTCDDCSDGKNMSELMRQLTWKVSVLP